MNNVEKTYMTYEDLKRVCQSIVDKIKREETEPFTEIVAVTRGGLTAAHIIAKELHLDIGVYSPKTDYLMLNNPDTPDKDIRLLVVEDLIAQGRTYNQFVKFMKRNCSGMRYEFCPILIDEEYTAQEFKYYGLIAREWIVFPYENSEKVVVGDRGLHRDGTDQYGGVPDNGVVDYE